MEKRIDKFIKKAEIIKDCLIAKSMETDNIDGLIKSLESYRDNVGDIPLEKDYFFTLYEPSSYGKYDLMKQLQNTYPIRLCNKELNTETEPWDSSSKFNVIAISLIDFTKHIKEILCDTGVHFVFIPPMSKEDNIADPIFDIQTYPINDNTLLITKLIEGGFKPTTTKIKFVCDFD